jgi:hypothetical protein
MIFHLESQVLLHFYAVLSPKLLHFLQYLFHKHITCVSEPERRNVYEIVTKIFHFERFQVKRCKQVMIFEVVHLMM